MPMKHIAAIKIVDDEGDLNDIEVRVDIKDESDIVRLVNDKTNELVVELDRDVVRAIWLML